MALYILRRLIATIPVLFGVSILIFLMVHLTPGDPARLMLGDYASAEQVERLSHELGLDQPLYIQYGRFVWNVLHGDFGRSIKSGRPVAEEIRERFWNTAELAAAGMAVAIFIGVLSGVVSAWKKDSWVDTTTMTAATLGVSIPSFWLGLMLIYLFSVRLGWLPVAGTGGLSHLVMPAVTLGLLASSVIARMTRSSMLEVLAADFIRTARAKGLGEGAVLLRHALKNALIPVVTIVGVQIASLLGGAFIIEQVFGWPGLGRLAVQSILARDYPTVQGVVMYVAVVYIAINLAVDLLYGWLNPRIRFD